MSANIVIPDELLKYILFQRTALISSSRKKLFSKLKKYSPLFIYEKALGLEIAARKDEIKKCFEDDIFQEYLGMKSRLPQKCSSILDIGCGVGAINIFFFQHYHSSKTVQFYLLDKTATDKKIYDGFQPKGAFYNSLSGACKLLVSNGIPENNTHLLEVPADYAINAPKGLDLIISSLSWGWHYPVSTYLDQVYDLLRKGGHLIMDLRRNQDGLKELKRKFSSVEVFYESRKQLRVLAIK